MIFSTILLILVHMMAGPVATCSGSSGGAEPPPGPYRLPSQCESAHDANNPRKKQRKGRGKAKGHGIADWVIRNGKITLTFDEEGDTWKAIGSQAAWWDSAVGIHTRDCCEPFYDNWKDVPHLQRAQVRERLLDWFDIDFEAQDGVFLDVVDRDANICYNGWKHKLNKHFKKSKTVEAAKVDRPDSVRDDAQWDRCCERFASEAFKGKSKKGSENRGKHKYKSYHGRRSYMQHRALKGNLETRELYSAIRNWKEMHQRGEIWANKNAEETYHKMEEELQRILAESTSGSASTSASASSSTSTSTSASTSGSTSINEVPIMGKVLGTQRGHTTGIGPTLPRCSHRRCSRSSQSRPTYHQHVKCETEINTLRMYLSQMLDVVRDLAPNAQLPDILIAPSSSSSATNGGDGDEDNVDTDLDD